MKGQESKRVLALVYGLQLLIFGSLAILRLVDGDEGFYLVAAKLVGEGKQPYGDFFFPQMPLLPAVYALWFACFGSSWLAARVLCALLASTIGTLLYVGLERVAGKKPALLGVFLYCTSSLVLVWFTVAKTQCLSATLLFLSFYLLTNAREGAKPRRFMLAGLVFGLSVCTRSFFIVAGPALLYAAVQQAAGAGKRRQRASRFVVGGMLAALLLALLVGGNWDSFYFGNVTYHSLRNADASLVGDFKQKLDVLLQLTGIQPHRWAVSLQFLVMAMACGASLFSWRKLDWRGRASLGVWLPLFLVSWLPTPTFLQYFAVAIPFMVYNASLSLAGGLGGEGVRTRGLVAVAVIYVLLLPKDLFSIVGWASPVQRFSNLDRTHQWSLPEIRRVSKLIDENATPGETVLTWWPGYLLESRASLFPGVENHFGITSELAFQSRGVGISEERMAAAVREKESALIVLGNWVGGYSGSQKERFEELILSSGWRLVGSVADTFVYRR